MSMPGSEQEGQDAKHALIRLTAWIQFFSAAIPFLICFINRAIQHAVGSQGQQHLLQVYTGDHTASAPHATHP
jgi:hypothetical protein